jgi:hypothetical protein
MKLAFELCKIEVDERLEMYNRLCMCNMAWTFSYSLMMFINDFARLVSIPFQINSGSTIIMPIQK